MAIAKHGQVKPKMTLKSVLTGVVKQAGKVMETMIADGEDLPPVHSQLRWPQGWKRTRVSDRKSSAFRVDEGVAHEEMLTELRRLHAKNIEISKGGSFVESGVAVYFDLEDGRRVIACDQYVLQWENVRAIGLSIKALRDLRRHGSSQILGHAVEGLRALPDPDAVKPWRQVLGFSADEAITLQDLEKRKRDLTTRHHPDMPGGSTARFQEIMDAYTRAQGDI